MLVAVIRSAADSSTHCFQAKILKVLLNLRLPVVGISVNAPTMLADVPQFRTYINAYDSKPQTMDALVDNLLSGADAFKGVDPIDSFCGLWDAKI